MYTGTDLAGVRANSARITFTKGRPQSCFCPERSSPGELWSHVHVSLEPRRPSLASSKAAAGPTDPAWAAPLCSDTFLPIGTIWKQVTCCGFPQGTAPNKIFQKIHFSNKTCYIKRSTIVPTVGFVQPKGLVASQL